MSLYDSFMQWNEQHNLLADIFLPSSNSPTVQDLTTQLHTAHQASVSGNNLTAQLALTKAKQDAGQIASTTQQAEAVANAPGQAAAAVGSAVKHGTSALMGFALVLVLGYAAVEALAGGK